MKQVFCVILVAGLVFGVLEVLFPSQPASQPATRVQQQGRAWNDDSPALYQGGRYVQPITEDEGIAGALMIGGAIAVCWLIGQAGRVAGKPFPGAAFERLVLTLVGGVVVLLVLMIAGGQ